MIKEEVEFTLPVGIVDRFGISRRDGVMHLAETEDEITLLQQDASKEEQYYLGLVLLSKVITRLGLQEHITPAHLEQVSTEDLDYLQDLYIQLSRRSLISVV